MKLAAPRIVPHACERVRAWRILACNESQYGIYDLGHYLTYSARAAY